MSQDSGYAPPPQGGKPWWVWALGGCGGCLVIVLIAGVALTTYGVNKWKNINVGPITEASVQQSLGVPIYPGAKLQPQITEITLKTLRFTPASSMFKGVGAYSTPGSPEQVDSFYQQKLPPLGWTAYHAQNTAGALQQQYRKGNEVLIVQEQQSHRPDMQGTMLILMRGTGKAAENAPTPAGQ